jgi:hypothetical protein
VSGAEAVREKPSEKEEQMGKLHGPLLAYFDGLRLGRLAAKRRMNI